MLLEREPTLADLSIAVNDAAGGRGSVVLVTGEAGIGKTSLIRAFADEAAGRARVLLSACDDLMASRTLGPLRDAILGSKPVARGWRRSPRPRSPACSRCGPTAWRSGTSWPGGRSSKACPSCGGSGSTRRSCRHC
jgi:AAA ATPase domain